MVRHGALFDLDGVLIDSEGVYYDFWNEIDKDFPTGIDNFAAYIKGSTLKRIMEYFTDEDVRNEITGRLERQERTMKFVIFDGVIPFLQQLKDRDVPCAIVTSSNEDKMHKLFGQHPGFSDYFKIIITDRQVTRSKPDPQGYLMAAHALGCESCDCIVFEDSFSGLEAGRRSGAKVVALSTTNPAESLADKADVVVASFTELNVGDLFEW